MKPICARAVVLALSACSSSQMSSTLTSAGVPATAATNIAVGVTAADQLFCQNQGIIFAAASIHVTQAQSAAVAAGCAASMLAGVQQASAVPVPPPPAGTVVPVATVPDAVSAAVAASVPGTVTK